MRKDRKGGMQLSINAIVILIIAMVVLGIGILFIRGMFGKAQTTTFKALTSQETTNPASAERPLVADRQLIVTPSDPSATLAVSVFNKGSTAEDDLTINLVNCTNSSGRDVTDDYGFTTVRGSIEPNSFSAYQTVVTLMNTTKYSPGDAVACSLEADLTTNARTYSTSVIVQVQSSK